MGNFLQQNIAGQHHPKEHIIKLIGVKTVPSPSVKKELKIQKHSYRPLEQTEEQHMH